MLTRRSSTMGWPCVAGSVGKAHPLLEVEAITGKRVAQSKVDEGNAAEDLQRRKRSFSHLATSKGQLSDADDGDERRALDEEDARTDKGRGGETEHLRIDNHPEHEAAAHPEAASGVPLRAWHGEDRCPEDLSHESTEVKRHDQHTAEDWR